MAQSLLAPFVLRPRQGAALLLPALAVALTVGCSHRRQSMRPVYLAPSRAVVAPAGCPPSVTPSDVSASPTTTIEPSGVEPVAPASTAPLSSAPSATSPVT